ncbi:MAG: hypothetical protein NVS3B12_17170 [Acidimicrobiales bacterium]
MSLTLLGWRRCVSDLYAEIRATPEPIQAHQIWQETRDHLLRTHPDSPVPASQRSSYGGAPLYPYASSLRFEAELDTDVAPELIEMTTGTDGLVRLRRLGSVHLAGVGSLDVWWHTGYGGGVFVPMRDGTAGRDTYGGGRYLLDTVKGADLGGDDRTLVVDLNFAYNPSCAYDPAWACPLASRGNTVAAEVRAGERTHHAVPEPS